MRTIELIELIEINIKNDTAFISKLELKIVVFSKKKQLFRYSIFTQKGINSLSDVRQDQR